MKENENQVVNCEEILVIGLTGGIGAGKTTVANILSKNGFLVISTDDLAKKLLSQNAEIRTQIIETFGENSYSDGKKYNSQYIASLVFTGNSADKNLQKLNQIIHPAVIEELIKMIDFLQKQFSNKNFNKTNNLNKKIDNFDNKNDKFCKNRIVFVESALLFELNLSDGFDYIITVTAKEENRILRAMERTNLSENEIKHRISKQILQEEKAKNSDFVIVNDGEIADLTKTVEFLLPIILELPNRTE